MTVRAEAASPRAPAAGIFLRSLARVLTTLRLPLPDRPPDASTLTERRLADIGLSRSDLPDHRGWRR